jgi:hypothetical protein
MEFFVVDPKDGDFARWTERVRTFLTEAELTFTEEDGGLYYLGDDVATPWAENSILFTVEGEETSGVIEVRDVDRNFYAFADDLSLFDDREVKEAVGLQARSPAALYGFRANDSKGCRFHRGPSTNLYFFCEDQEADYPHAMSLEDVWGLFFRSVHWLSNNTSRIQDFKQINVEKVHMDFHADVEFSHPASLDYLVMEMLSDDEGFERSKNGLKARFRDRDLAWMRQFVKHLPPEQGDFVSAQFKAVWWGICEGEEREIFYAGVEKRELRPFIQLPVHRTSKGLMDKFRVFFKGHRIDRQEYYIEES